MEKILTMSKTIIWTISGHPENHLENEKCNRKMGKRYFSRYLQKRKSWKLTSIWNEISNNKETALCTYWIIKIVKSWIVPTMNLGPRLWGSLFIPYGPIHACTDIKYARTLQPSNFTHSIYLIRAELCPPKIYTLKPYL